jgi:hypothetical protein
MAIIDGPFNFNGSFGGFRSYRDGDTGKQILSTKRRKNSKNYKNKSSAARVNELNIEFKALNIWAKLIRSGTAELVYLKKGRINGKLVSIGKRIQLMNTFDKRGHRRIESSKFNYPLIGFCMNNAHPFKAVCNVEPEISITDDRREVTLKLTNFISHLKFKWNETVSYYRIYLTIFELSDVEWNESEKAFYPVYPGNFLNTKTIVSDWIAVSTDPIDFQISTSFDQNALPREKTTVVVSVGFEFATAIQHNTPYVVKDNGTMAIMGCF